MSSHGALLLSSLGRSIITLSISQQVPDRKGTGRPRLFLVPCPHINNNPVNGTDSSGHCIDGISTIVCLAVAGAFISAGVNYTGQVINNLQSGKELEASLTQVDIKQVVVAGVAGAAGGAAGGFIAGAIAPVASAFIPSIGAVIEGVASGAVANAAYGQVQAVASAAWDQAAEHTYLEGNDIVFGYKGNEFLSDASALGAGNLTKIENDAVVGGFFGGVGSGLKSIFTWAGTPDLTELGKLTAKWVPPAVRTVDVFIEKWTQDTSKKSTAQ